MQAARMCFCAASLCRISVAAFGSLKLNAAVLCSANNSALTARSSTMSRRNSARSLATNAAQASSRATLLVSMMMTISFRFRETSRRKGMLLLVGFALDLDHLRQAQQFRADLQAGLLGGVEVDLQLHVVLAVHEGNDASLAGKGIGFAHGQNTRAPKGLEGLRQIILLRRRDEKNVTGLHFSNFLGLLRWQ